MRIIIDVIDHKDQRYSTVGDWQYDEEGNLIVKVSKLGSWKKESLVGLHEIIEALLCRSAGVSEHDVDQFDFNFKGDGEPGDDPNCPYRRQHFFAETVERMMADKFHIDFAEYEKQLEAL